MKMPRPQRLALWLAVGAFLLAGGCGPPTPSAVEEASEGLPAVVDYNFHIKPILSDRCYACHGPDDNARKAEFRLDTPEGAFAPLHESSRSKALVPGNLSRSEAYYRLVSTDPAYQMPPPESNLSVTPREVALIAKWIEQGAEYKPHWSFIPPEPPALPDVRDAAWPRNGIDHFVLARLEREGLQPAPEASKETLIRRATFDLTGLPPTLDEIDAFLTDDAPDAYEKVVDRLLASDAYGERMAADWLDVARYADTHGYQDDGMRTMWPWRDWVIDAFNRNLPYDAFVTWQLAGDLLPEPTREQRLATGFNRNHLQSQEGGIVAEEYRVEYVADRAQTFAKAFLGLTMECARCHDHKFDPISQKEYYRVFAFFNSVNEYGNSPYAGEASPALILVDDEAEQALQPIRARMRTLEAEADPANTAYDGGFERWLARAEAEPAAMHLELNPAGHYPLDGFEESSGRHTLKNLASPAKPAFFAGDVDKLPYEVPAPSGSGLMLRGDGWLDMGPDHYFFERNEPFTVSLWLNIEADGTEGPLFSKSGGLFNGKRGYVCELRADGTVSASLNHVFPDNSIEVVSREPIPAGVWHHLVMAYDGSSRAAGLRLYLDGRPMASEVRVDNLQRSLRYTLSTDGEETNWGDPGTLRIGFVGGNMPRLEGVAVDEFKVFDRRLTAVEVAALNGAHDLLKEILSTPAADRTQEQAAALRDYYVTVLDPAYRRVFGELTGVRGQENAILSHQTAVMVMRDTPEPRPTYVLNRGAYDAPTTEVRPGTPEAVLAFADSLPSNRLGLARWLFSPRHPLTGRVIVNRYWQMHFGRGIVATPDDFGSQGALPTHPALLDWLATTFEDGGWDMKALHRLIVTSATYRQSSVAGPKLLERDPANELLARGPSYRLPAEMVRDNALAVSGLLVRTLGGPSVKPYQPAGLWEELATRNATVYVQDKGDKLYRRSMYTIWKRTTPPPSMMSFDASERNFCTVRRQSTSTPLQALILLNDPQYVEAARVLAERMIREGGPALHDRLTFAFRLLTSRHPTPDELGVLEELAENERKSFAADPMAANALLSVGEHPRDPALDAPEVASLAVVANTIMNYDEAVIKR